MGKKIFSRLAVFGLAALLVPAVVLAACQEAPEVLKNLPEDVQSQAAGALQRGLDGLAGPLVQGLDWLKNAEHPGGPFANNLDSARAYTLAQLEEKYGKEFVLAGEESLVNYGLFAGASYSCTAAPADDPSQTVKALVSQTLYTEVRDDYAKYLFWEEATAPVSALCREKEYIQKAEALLEMPGTARIWTAEDPLEEYLSESGAYVKTVLHLEEGLSQEEYGDMLFDFLHSLEGLSRNLLVQARAGKRYLFHEEVHLLEGFDPDTWTREKLRKRMEEEFGAE